MVVRVACYSGLITIPSRGEFDSLVAGFHLGRVPHADLRGAGRAAGGECKLHCLKHAIVTHLLDAGADLAFVQDWIGLVNIQTTTFYVRLTTQRWTSRHAQSLRVIG